mgnify:CR=1 FL=1
MSGPLYLLCLTCRRAWISHAVAACCNTRPLTCSPWSPDARTWFRARLADGWRAAAVSALANLTSSDHMRLLLGLGIERRNRTWSTWEVDPPHPPARPAKE